MYDIKQFIYQHFQEDYLEYGSPVSDLRVNCPFCLERYGSDDTKYKLHISLQIETCHCFRCDYTASWIRLVMDLKQLDYHAAVGQLYKKPSPSDIVSLTALYEGKSYIRRERPKTSIIFPRDYVSLVKYIGKPNPYKSYMLRRGFNEDHFQYYSIGVAPVTSPHRVYIPVEGTYYQARAVYDFMQPKYMTPREESEDLIFNSIALQLYEEVVITEGCISAMAVGKNAIALLGANPTDGKFIRLRDSDVRHFIITVETGKEVNMVQLARRLAAYGKRVTMWYYPEDKDPADGVATQITRYDMREHVRVLLSKP